MGKRLFAVVVVVASACTALHYSVTSQKLIVVSNNPYHYSTAGSQVFVLSPASSADDDILQQIYLDNCASQWTLNLFDPQAIPGAHVCGGLGSGGSAMLLANDDLISCPRNYQFGVSYAGTLPGLSSCNVMISSSPANNGSAFQLVTLMLSGSGSGVVGISMSPLDIDFKDVQQLTQSSPGTVMVKNNGSASTTVITTLGGSGFQVNPAPGTFGVGPGSSAFFNVTCTPPGLGPLSGTFTAVSGPQILQTSLECNGIDSTVTIAPTQVTFDNTLVGRAPPPKTVRISGNSSATIQDVSLDAAAMAAGVTITANPMGSAVGSGQDVGLAYDAAAMHAAGPLGALSIKVSSDANPRSVGISGQALVGGVGTNPASVELGGVCIGSTVMKDIEVYADEPGDVQLVSLTPPAPPYGAMSMQTLPKVLGGNHSGPSVTVRATLTPTTPGDLKDAIALNSDVPNTPTSEVQLHAVALAAGIAATPDFVHFGTAAADSTTSIKEVQLSNCGTTPLDFTRAQITGAFADEFTLIGANPARTLAPTESEIFMVVMQPESAGEKLAALVIEHSQGTTTVQLDGTGEGGEGSNKDRETYYACSTGRSTALWPLAFALLLLRRRRR